MLTLQMLFLTFLNLFPLYLPLTDRLLLVSLT
jgi:hypothetical protein